MSEPFKCPTCGAVSHNLKDKQYGYCGRCKKFVFDTPDGAPLRIASAAPEVVLSIGKLLLRFFDVISKKTEATTDEILISTLALCGWLLRERGVEIDPDLPLRMQLPALWTGYSEGHNEADDEQSTT